MLLNRTRLVGGCAGCWLVAAPPAHAGAGPAVDPSVIEVFVIGNDLNTVSRFDGFGEFVDHFVGPGDGLDKPSHLAFGPDGDLYVANFGPSEVVRFDGVTGAGKGSWFRNTAVLEEPVRVLFRDGLAYVLGNDTQNVVVLDGSTGVLVDEFGSGGGEIPRPADMRFGPDGLLYVAGTPFTPGEDTIERWDVTAGMRVDSFGPTDEFTFSVNAIGFGPDGMLYVAESANDAIFRVDPVTLEHEAFITSGRLDDPIEIEFGPDGLLYVTNWRTNIVRYTPEGEFVDEFVSFGEGGLTDPRGVAFRIAEPCLADVNRDGEVTPTDFGAWLTAFNAGDPAADQNLDGEITPTDFGAWLTNFNAGCD